MTDELSKAIARVGADSEIQALLNRVCELTGMGFAAVAYVTETRWIACQVEDRIAFGLKPGEELEVKKTICDDIRQSGRSIAIDDTNADPDWWSHPVPILYGFRSYVSLPIVIAGKFFGTLCAIDDAPRAGSLQAIGSELEALAKEMAELIRPRLPSEIALT